MPMTGSWPLVSIGMPVYNGERFLAAALCSLLEQDYPNFEIVISDNASDDATARICREFAERDKRIVYGRNSENIGMLPNFAAVLHRAHGEYFLWAAHDDTRNSQFIRRLAEQLMAAPEAVLSTPVTIHIDPEGHYLPEAVDRPALNGRTLDNARRYCKDRPYGWYYGLWRTAFLQSQIAEIVRRPTWSGDEIFLLQMALGQALAGDERAILYLLRKPNPLAPKTARAKLHCLCYMSYYLTKVGLQYEGSGWQRVQALLIAWRLLYQGWIRRSNPLSTVWYHSRLLVAAAVSGVWLGLRRIFAGRPRPSLPMAATIGSGNTDGKMGRAA